ncbi:helix-turn-helix domain-containing protein [Kibdelosporangium philippinense]|uniref:Helix-turn-helix domain-containing protein n=1 Tax=Kibdelosporangium philippinense TaxID=211113 RepID=A0ABS8ZKW4_9PSEU|nr:helix-turn-helix transcriptional regulator [Kibdelosporangium philippinense]MCE7007600.1 helix-turn-helix domain-containing protein [Kibdelosporangium philippinense]
MGTPGLPNYHGRQLLRELKRLREQADMTQEEAGTRLHLTLQKLSRIENGQLPGYHELRAMLRLYGLPPEDWNPRLELWELAKKRGWWRDLGLKDGSYVCMENEAARAVEFSLGLLPALVQTERYARASLQHVSDAEAAVTVRIRRQRRLFSDEKPLVLHALIHEPAVQQGVDREQLVHLVERAQLPNVTLQIVPQSAGLHGGLEGSMTLLEFPDPDEPDIVCTETVLGLAQSQDRDTVVAARHRLDQLVSLALTPEDSLDTIKALIW